MNDVEITDNPDARRYEARIDGDTVGYASYVQDEPGRLVILHVEVDPASEGRGIGTQIVDYALADAAARHLEVVPRCSFAASVIAERPATSR